MKLSILCVSQMTERAQQFVDCMASLATDLKAEFVLAVDGKDVHSKGYIESVLDEALAMTHGEYILRLDDDEKCSRAMEEWLYAGEFLAAGHWSFPRAHLFEDPKTMLMDPPFFPDYQTRLSIREKAGQRTRLHQTSPFGLGSGAPVCLEHWYFLVKTSEEMAERSQFYTQMTYGDGPRPVDSREQSWPVRLCDYDERQRMPLEHAWVRDGKIR